MVSHELTVYLSIFNQFEFNGLLTYYQKHVNQNSLKLSFTNICSLCSNFVDCKFFLESNSPDVLVLCETNLGDSIDSGNFSMRGYLPLIPKDSSTDMHSLTVYVKERLPFARDLSLENQADSYLPFWLPLLHSVSDFFLRLSITFFIFLHSFWFYFIWHRWGSLNQQIW